MSSVPSSGGWGDSKSPLCFIAVACGVNIALDYWLMGGLGLGPVGAALGTTLSQAVSVLLALLVISRRDHGLRLTREDFRLRRRTVGKLLRIGVPVALQDGFIQISFLLITVIANRRGLIDAAVGIVEKIVSFLFLVPSTMLSTVSALGAQNIGAGKRERAVQTLRCAMAIAVGLGLAVSLGVQAAAEPMVGLFTPDTAVVRAGGQYLRGYVWDCLFAGVQFSFSGYFCACGRSELSFLHNVLSIVRCAFPGRIWRPAGSPRPCFPWALPARRGRCSPLWSAWRRLPCCGGGGRHEGWTRRSFVLARWQSSSTSA